MLFVAVNVQYSPYYHTASIFGIWTKPSHPLVCSHINVTLACVDGPLLQSACLLRVVCVIFARFHANVSASPSPIDVYDRSACHDDTGASSNAAASDAHLLRLVKASDLQRAPAWVSSLLPINQPLVRTYPHTEVIMAYVSIESDEVSCSTSRPFSYSYVISAWKRDRRVSSSNVCCDL